MSSDSFLQRLRTAFHGERSETCVPQVSSPFEPGRTSVLAALAESIGGMPRVLLRDTDPCEEPSPVVKPARPRCPAATDRSGRFQLFGEIARGGMGAVLKGRDPDLGRDLAVKVLLEEHRDQPELVRRFVEEAQIGGQLQHPGVVPVYELGTFADRRPYFTMKLVKGRTLADAARATRRSAADDLPRFLAIFEQVCQTMAYAHARGVIHRDLKPSNVMVGSFGEVQVMDWGLAKVLPRGGAADDDARPSPARRVSVDRARRGAARTPDASQAGSRAGHAGLHGARAGAGRGRRGRRAGRRLRPGLDPLRDPHRPAGVHRPATRARSCRKAARGDLADAFARLDAAGRARADRPGQALPGRRARGPAAQRRRGGRRDHGLPGRRAGAAAAGRAGARRGQTPAPRGAEAATG